MRQRQVQLTACTILSNNIADQFPNGLDIIKSVQRIDVYESIFQNTISGSIAVTENVGWVEGVPFVGIEFVYLSFSIISEGETKSYNRLFRVTKVHEQTYLRYDLRTYTIEFVTSEFFASASKRISRRFQMSCGEAVQSIVENDLRDKTISSNAYAPFVSPSPLPTWGQVDIVIPNYTPLRAINYFATLSLEAEDRNSGGYLFFETLDGLHFTSIRRLIASGKTKTVPTIQVHTALKNTSGDNVDTERDAIFRIHQEQTFDLLGGVASGLYRSRALHFDLLSNKFVSGPDDTSYTESFKQSAHLNKYPLFPEYFDENEFSPNIRQFVVPTNIWSTANLKSVVGKTAYQNEQLMHESVTARNRQLKELRQLETLLELPGQPNIHAGSVINVVYPPTRPMAGNDTSTQSSGPPIDGSPHSGYHLVASVHHIIVVKSSGDYDYRMSLRVVNDSLNRPLRVKSAKPPATV
jgi:hypothetical protein